MSTFLKGSKCIYRAIPIVGDGKHTRHELYLMAINPKPVVSDADKKKKAAAKKAKAKKAAAKKAQAKKLKAEKAAAKKKAAADKKKAAAKKKPKKTK